MSGLDPAARVAVKSVLRRLAAEGRTLFFTSHVLADVDELCSSIAVLDRGRMRLRGTPAALRARYGEAEPRTRLHECIRMTNRKRLLNQGRKSARQQARPAGGRRRPADHRHARLRARRRLRRSTPATRARTRSSCCASCDAPPPLALVDLGLPPAPHSPDEGFRADRRPARALAAHEIFVLSGPERRRQRAPRARARRLGVRRQARRPGAASRALLARGARAAGDRGRSRLRRREPARSPS